MDYIEMIEYFDIQTYKLDAMDESITKTFADHLIRHCLHTNSILHVYFVCFYFI